MFSYIILNDVRMPKTGALKLPKAFNTAEKAYDAMEEAVRREVEYLEATCFQVNEVEKDKAFYRILIHYQAEDGDDYVASCLVLEVPEEKHDLVVICDAEADVQNMVETGCYEALEVLAEDNPEKYEEFICNVCNELDWDDIGDSMRSTENDRIAGAIEHVANEMNIEI